MCIRDRHHLVPYPEHPGSALQLGLTLLGRVEQVLQLHIQRLRAEMCIRDRVKAISTAASVTIPAGETTWGAVFIANGLQLILAVLLIVLGLNLSLIHI